MTAAAELEQRGFLVAAIRPPSVPRGTSRLRIKLSAAHSAADVDRLAESLATVLAGDARPRTTSAALR
jgi:8-amino-7-oxononanoate synthase